MLSFAIHWCTHAPPPLSNRSGNSRAQQTIISVVLSQSMSWAQVLGQS